MLTETRRKKPSTWYRRRVVIDVVIGSKLPAYLVVWVLGPDLLYSGTYAVMRLIIVGLIITRRRARQRFKS